MRRFWSVAVVAGVMILAVAGGTVSGAMEKEPTDASCADVEFVWVRGSGQKLGEGGELVAYEERIDAQMKWKGVMAKYEFYEVDYPAVELDVMTTAGAWASAGQGWEYGESVKVGVANLTAHLERQSAGCPGEKFVLAGYSQGAQVVAESLKSMDASEVIYVALLGEPKLYLPEGYAPLGIAEACSGKGRSVYRAWAPNCYTYEGALAARRPYIPGVWAGKVGLYCNSHDFVCGSSMNPADNDGHGKYGERMSMVAANIAGRVVEVLPTRGEIDEEMDLVELAKMQAVMDTVILVDSTRSMRPYIEAYKDKARELAEATLAAGGRVALAEYRDYEDEGYPKMLCGFGCGLEQFSALIGGIEANEGGDDKEGLLAAMMMVYEELDWREGAAKSLVVLTDAGYHAPDKSGVNYMDVVKKSIAIDPVNTYIITTNTFDRYSLGRLAEDTGGKLFATGNLTDEFLDGTAEYLVGRPMALLALGEYWAAEGGSLYFDASGSYGVGSEIVRYDWDFDGDGKYEVMKGGAEIEWSYEGEFEGYAVVRATDEDGRQATMSAKVRVGGGPPERAEAWRPEVIESGGDGIAAGVEGDFTEEEGVAVDAGREEDDGEVSAENVLEEIGVPATGARRRGGDARGTGAVMVGIVLLGVASVGLANALVARRRGR